MDATVSWLFGVGVLLMSLGFTVAYGEKRPGRKGITWVLLGFALIVVAGLFQLKHREVKSEEVTSVDSAQSKVPPSGSHVDQPPISSVVQDPAAAPSVSDQTTGKTQDESVQFTIIPGGILDFVAGQRASVKMNYRNDGGSIRNMNSYVYISISPYPLSPNHIIPSPEAPSSRGSGTLPPGMVGYGFAQFDSPLSTEQVNAVLEGDSYRLYVEGRVGYLHGTHHCSREFMFSTGGPKLREAIHELQTTGKSTSNDFWDYEGGYSNQPESCSD